ncbi:MAG: energy transducer TonB [Pseudomonadota bacterium]
MGRTLWCGLGLLILAGACQTEIVEENSLYQSCVGRLPDYDLIAERAKAKAAGEAASRHNAELGFGDASKPQPETHVKPVLTSTPVVNFPVCAASVGVEGSCEVYHDVTKDGKAENIIAICTSAFFVSEAKRTVGRFEYSPASINGEAVAFKGVILPLKFVLEDDQSVTPEN